MTIKKILVPTDFSNAANNALFYAKDIAKKYGAQVHIVHVFQIPLMTARGIPILAEDDVVQADLRIAEEQLEKTKKMVAENCNVIFNSNVILIHWQIEFAEVIHRQKADLIVVGSTGASGLKKIFMGSNAARIVQDSPVPVLTIPENARLSQLSKIGLAFDGLPIKELNKFSIINSFRDVLKASIHVFQIMSNKESPSTHLSNLRSYLPDSEYSDVYESEVEAGILKSIELNHLDMMVMLPRQRGFFHSLIRGSITKRVAYEISIPLLAIPE